MRIFRFLLAVLIAPMAPAAFFVASSTFNAITAAQFSYQISLVVGLPVTLALHYFKRLTFMSLILAGAILGALSLLYFGASSSDSLASVGVPISSSFYLKALIWGAGYGALVAGIFGVIVGSKSLRGNRSQG